MDHTPSQEFVLGGPDNRGAEVAEIQTPKALATNLLFLRHIFSHIHIHNY